jgi:hypothetical protein
MGISGDGQLSAARCQLPSATDNGPLSPLTYHVSRFTMGRCIMVASCSALTIYKDDVSEAVAQELDDLRVRMLRDLESFLSSGLTQRANIPAGRTTNTSAGMHSSVGRRIRA